MIDAEFAPLFFKLLPLCLSFTGMFSALFFYTFFSKDLYLLKTSQWGRKFYVFLNKKWFFDKVYNEFVVQRFLN
jgi:NADH:ubiquinone oxidoreductase subunit 5 (subunit L)/multisubunit Na+/H+ antiporter MnhA subunit